jgi:hypothetical protein
VLQIPKAQDVPKLALIIPSLREAHEPKRRPLLFRRAFAVLRRKT